MWNISPLFYLLVCIAVFKILHVLDGECWNGMLKVHLD